MCFLPPELRCKLTNLQAYEESYRSPVGIRYRTSQGAFAGNIRNFNKMVDVFDPRKDIVPLK